MPVIKLSDESLKAYSLPEGKTKIELCDTDVKGLVANISATHPGKAQLVFKFKDHGKTSRRPLGRFPEVSVDHARLQAKKLKDELTQGVDITSYMAAPGNAPKLNDFVSKVWLPAQKERVKPNTYIMYESITRLYVLPAIGKYPMDQVRKRDVMMLMTKLRERGLAAATTNRTLATIRACYNYAIDMEVVEFNPASKVKLYKEPQKERYLSKVELARLLKTLDKDPNQNVCRVIRFALYTGARIGEILNAEAAEISVDNRTWTIPAKHSKSGRSRTVPLNAHAMSVVEELDLNHPTGSLFVGRLGEPLRNVHRVWGRIRKSAELPDLNLHSLRHQYASLLVNSGRSMAEIGKILGHSSVRTTERYTHLQAATLREASDSICAHIDEALAHQE